MTLDRIEDGKKYMWLTHTVLELHLSKTLFLSYYSKPRTATCELEFPLYFAFKSNPFLTLIPTPSACIFPAFSTTKFQPRHPNLSISPQILCPTVVWTQILFPTSLILSFLLHISTLLHTKTCNSKDK